MHTSSPCPRPSRRSCAPGPRWYRVALGLATGLVTACGFGDPPPLRAAAAAAATGDEAGDGGWTDVPAPPWPGAPEGSPGAAASGDPPQPSDEGSSGGAGEPGSGGAGSDVAGAGSDGSDAAGGSEASGEPTPPPSLVGLRIVEVLPNPDGTDGAALSPEWVALQNTASGPLPLLGLELAARGWPLLSAADLGVEGLELAPGELLIVQRWASSADVPPDLPLAAVPAGVPVWWAGTGGSGGLRNTDGAVQLADAHGPLELLVYGGPSLEPPWDDPTGWPGEPALAPASGRSLCADLTAEPGSASAWLDCAPGAAWGAGG